NAIPEIQLQRLNSSSAGANGNSNYSYAGGGPLIMKDSNGISPSVSGISIGGNSGNDLSQNQSYPGSPNTTSLGAVFSSDLGSEKLYRQNEYKGLTVLNGPQQNVGGDAGAALAAPAFGKTPTGNEANAKSGAGSVTAGNQSGNLIASGNAIDALMFPS